MAQHQGSTSQTLVDGVALRAPIRGRYTEIISPDALAFVANLHREFNPIRERLLAARAERRARIREGETPDFLPSTRRIREEAWTVAHLAGDLEDRRVEITGPVERKMMINALNSGASVFMADFEDALTATWDNVMGGQVNLTDAVRRTIEYTAPDGKVYRLGERTATLLVRPRGWHLVDSHMLIDGQPISASLLDFGLYFYHNAQALLERGTGPYFYLPKLESHLEARLWNDVFLWAQDALRVPRGAIKATVLIEHVLAAFEMDEILYELRDHSGGLNAGRWDYIHSVIKTFGGRADFVLPDRAQVTMTVPFMRAYTELLVKTCHRRGAYAVGGMAAFIPNRRDPEVTRTALDKVRDDKLREAGDGFDGTWVVHPDLVPTAMKVFTEALGGRPHQLGRQRPEVSITASELLGARIPGGSVSEAGLRSNVSVAIRYVESWLRGVGAAAINNLMEDTATAEISRSQVWQWIRHHVSLVEGPRVTRDLVRQIETEELDRIRGEIGAEAFARGRFEDARALVEAVALEDEFVEFLTGPGYARLTHAAQEQEEPA